MKICTKNKMIDEEINLFYNALIWNDKFISERLHLPATALDGAGYGRNAAEAL